MQKKLLLLLTVCLLHATVQAEEWNWTEWAKSGVEHATREARKIGEQAKALSEKAEAFVVSSIQEIKERLAAPKVDEHYDRKKKQYVLTADISSYDKKDITIEFQKDKKIVTIKGSKTVFLEEKDSKGRVIKKESSKKSFQTSIKLPNDIIVTDATKIKAKQKNGTLTILIPATKAVKDKKQTITISVIDSKK